MAGVRAVALLAALLAAVVALAVWWALGGQPGRSAPLTAGPAPRLVDEALGAGLAHAYDGDFQYYVGGGAAALDCNDDLLPDLYLAGGAGPAALFVNRSAPGGGLAFEPLSSAVTDLDAVTGAYPLDFDSDGRLDLAVLRQGENVLLRGTGDCSFERANEAWQFAGGDAWSTAFSARWDPGADWPTLAVGNYLASGTPGEQPVCLDNELFRPAASGGAFAPPEALAPSWCTLSMLFSDWDRSGRRDLRVSNDRHYYGDYSDGAEQLWRIDPGQPPRQYTAADGWQRVRVFGMGIATADLTGDGYPEYYLTSQADNKLQALADGPSQPRFEDIALRRGATAQRPYAGDTALPSTAWHAEFQDLNNDALLDLFVAKGNVEQMLDHAARDPSNLLLGQADGSFVESGDEAGLAADFARARGALVVDLNLDGLLDLVVVVRRENVRAYRNVGAGAADAPVALGNWIAIVPRQSGANRNAVGAWVELRVSATAPLQRREIFVGGGHVSGAAGPLHFGIADAGGAEVRVAWPDGATGPWLAVEAGHVYLVERDSNAAQVIGP